MSELESAIADTGALLVRAQKYRRGASAEGGGLVREALALGDTARRLHRRGALDDAGVGSLLAEARALAGRLRALIAAVRGAPDYREAVRAHAAGDHATLAGILPTIFSGLDAAPVRVDLFTPVAWLRRGRLRPVSDVVGDVVQARTQGLLGEGDDLSPGADAELPAVALRPDATAEEPVILRLPAAALPAPALRLEESGDHLIHAARLRGPMAVRLPRDCTSRSSSGSRSLPPTGPAIGIRSPPPSPRLACQSNPAERGPSGRSGAQAGAQRSHRVAQGGVGLEPPLDGPERVNHRRVIASAELRADAVQRHLGVLPAEVHRDLPR